MLGGALDLRTTHVLLAFAFALVEEMSYVVLFLLSADVYPNPWMC